ncbi:hypothetical protein BS17DRAFT_856895 [Gyrodon lividus]|nr:hypothetical protein BS17DRAFT_856895 [Gyrodon lividus]
MDDFSRKVAQYITDEVIIQEASSNEEWQEEHVLPLPSNIGLTQCQDTGLSYLLEQELELRQGQANEALHNIRLNLGHCSFLYRTSVWQVKHSQQKKSHAWDAIHQVNAALKLKLHTVVYCHCQKSMVTLGASLAMLEKYQVLKPEHLESRTIKIDPSVRGTCSKNLPWFWRLNVNMKEDNWMSEH